MNERTPFSLPIDNLTSLAPGRAVEFFRRLLWAESARTGVGGHLIDVPDSINVADGGIDAVTTNAQPTNDEVIPTGTTGYQIKSADLTPANCGNELHQGNTRSQPIKPEIKRILDAGGNYVLVLFVDITPAQKRRREAAIEGGLKTLGYQNPRFRVYTANQLAGFAERFPALVAWFMGDAGDKFQPYSSWAGRTDIGTPRTFIYDDKGELEKAITSIREKLRTPTESCPVFRVTGLPGIGKSRFVFESLSPDDLKGRVVYAVADAFLSSSLFYALQNNDALHGIAVIDECDADQHVQLVRSLAGRGSRLALFTISYDERKVPEPALLYELTPLGHDDMKKIIQSEAPALPAEVVDRLARFADGYPRIAVLLVESYLASDSSREQFLRISDDALMDRLIGARMDTNSERFRLTKKILRGISLFNKVGFAKSASSEAKWLADYLGVPKDDFKDIVEEQRKRGIIQGDAYIYVTPFMLRTHLLTDWWESQGFTQESFITFINSIPAEYRNDLTTRFLDHIPYVANTKQGREFTGKVLSRDGIFADGSLLGVQLGADFFRTLAQANPEAALECLQRTIGTWTKEKLSGFTIGRREVVWALEGIAMWRELFPDAARLLLALGEAENETWSNNASGVFADLFSPGVGRVAPTEASPEERFPILKEALEHDSKERRLLALRACDQALETQHFVRAIGSEYQGLRKEPQLWMPKTYGELFDAYRQVWTLLNERLDTMTPDEQQEAVTILLHRARGLAEIGNLADMVIESVSALAQKPYVDAKKVLAEVTRILHYDSKRLPASIRERWEELKDILTGSDLPSLLKRYVGMELLEDHFDDEGNQVDQAQPRIEELAQLVVENHDLLLPELGWLVTTEAQNGGRFGYELGKRDRDFSLLSTLCEAQRTAGATGSAYLLGGYFKALFEEKPDEWERHLDALAEDADLNVWVPELTWRSGLTDRAALRILNLAEKGTMGIGRFQMFAYGGVIRKLSEDVFTKWVRFLLGAPETSAVSIALDLYTFYYIHGKSEYTLPEELTLELLTHQSLFQRIQEGKRGQMDEYHWTQIGEAFVRSYPERSLKLADKTLEYFGEEGTIVGSFFSETQTVLNEIFLRHRKEVWRLVTKYLGPPIDSRAFHIKDWLRGGEHYKAAEGMLPTIPPDEIWKWVDENVEKRAWYIASFVPNRLFREAGRLCLAREVLVRYGDREDVRRNLMANFSTESWWGSESTHHETKKRELLEFKENEDDDNVKGWIDEYVYSLDQHIERARIEEEREG